MNSLNPHNTRCKYVTPTQTTKAEFILLMSNRAKRLISSLLNDPSQIEEYDAKLIITLKCEIKKLEKVINNPHKYANDGLVIQLNANLKNLQKRYDNTKNPFGQGFTFFSSSTGTNGNVYSSIEQKIVDKARKLREGQRI